MDGKTLKFMLEKEHVKISQIAQSMGVTEEYVYSKLKAKDLKISFIQSVAKATNKSVSYWLGEKKNENAEIVELLRENRELRKEIDRLKENANCSVEPGVPKLKSH